MKISVQSFEKKKGKKKKERDSSKLLQLTDAQKSLLTIIETGFTVASNNASSNEKHWNADGELHFFFVFEELVKGTEYVELGLTFGFKSSKRTGCVYAGSVKCCCEFENGGED